MDWNLIAAFCGAGITTVCSVWSLAWWLSKQFQMIRHLVYDRVDATAKMIMDKIEYHEQHDDSRFQAISNDLWELRIHNAAKEGRTVEPRIPISDRNGN